MKNLTFIALALVATSAQADFWDNCTANGGTIITANSYGNDKGGLCNDPSNPNLTNNCNGKRFCMSGKGMNWWSAFTWCEAIGGKLANLSNMCPSAQQTSNYYYPNACPNLLKAISTEVWSDNGSNQTSRALFIAANNSIYDGGGHSDNNRNATKFRAFCEER